MKTRTVHSHKKNQAFLGTKTLVGAINVTEFFSHPAEVHSVTLGRVYDEYTSSLTEDWTFIGESEDWELLSKGSTAV